MNTIERVADLLGSFEPATTTSPPADKGAAARTERDARARAVTDTASGRSNLENYERLVDEGVGNQERQEPRSSIGRVPSTEEVREPPDPRPLIQIDRAHLRRQGIMTPDDARTPVAESFRRIKRQILANSVRPRMDNGTPSNLVLVTSSVPGEGKSFCSVNLAISIALEVNRTVLLVDADVGKPSIPGMLGIRTEQGLLDVLVDRRIDLGQVMYKTDIGKLSLLAAGTPHVHATELLASDAMRGLLQEMANRYRDRIIIFDSPPLLAASEAAVIASQMGQVVMIVEAGKTPEPTLKSAMARLDSSNIAGVLLNKGHQVYTGDEYGAYTYRAK